MIAAYQCILEGHEYRELAVYEGGEPEEGKNILAITLEESELNDNYNGATYLDTMKASAVDDYLASTHDKYHKELSKDARSASEEYSRTNPTEALSCAISQREIRNPYPTRMSFSAPSRSVTAMI